MSRLQRYLLCLVLVPAGIAADADSITAKAQETNTFPSGMIAMFAGSACPAGWTDEPLTQGRIPIGAAASAEVGELVGEPIVDKEPKPHLHSYSITKVLPGSEMTLGENYIVKWVYPQVLEFKGKSVERNSNLPFVAIPMCRRSVQP